MERTMFENSLVEALEERSKVILNTITHLDPNVIRVIIGIVQEEHRRLVKLLVEVEDFNNKH